ncbi:MAG: hypothetical protein Q7I96_02805 [Methanobacteriaceae archaeon]|nr:hypothetical protein [Methanobacteriaceae archaeon]
MQKHNSIIILFALGLGLLCFSNVNFDHLITTDSTIISDVLSASLAFIGTVIALFFTLIALPIQNILGRYSQDLVKKITGDKKLRAYFIASLMIFGFNLSVFLFIKSYFVIPLTEIKIYFISFSFTLTLLYLILLFFYINRVYHLLDIRNTIKEISSDITSIMKKEEGAEINDSIEQSVDLILDVTQKAIQENRFEIVESGFKEIRNIILEYITINNGVLGNFGEKLFDIVKTNIIISISMVSNTSHPKIIKSISTCVGDITLDSLEIKRINNIDGYIFTEEWIQIIKNILISPELVKDTSNIPVELINRLVKIAGNSLDLKGSIGQKIIVGRVISVLIEVNKIATIDIANLRGTVIAQKVNNSITSILNYILDNYEKIDDHKEIFIKKIINELGENLKIIFTAQSPIDNIAFSPLTIGENNFSKLSQKILEITIKDTTFNGLIIISDIITILSENINITIQTKYDLAIQLLKTNYTIGFRLINFLDNINNENLKNRTSKLISNLLTVLFNNMEIYLNSSEDRIYEVIDLYFSFIGIIFVKDSDQYLSEIIQDNISKTIELLSDIPDKSLLEPYIRLMGVWILKFNPDDVSNLEKIKNETIKQSELLKNMSERDLIIIGGIIGIAYPDMVKNKDIDRPDISYSEDSHDLKDLDIINQKLFNEEDIEKFENYLDN